ncbi:MAG: hypothetical protein IKZ28_00775, partial [Clostridia bacterium]|nr:hypothetical protein [Clostridia bacterium]
AADTGLNFSLGTTIWISTNYGRGAWASECVKDYFDDALHNIKLTIIGKKITLTVDGEVLAFWSNGVAYTPTLTEESVYLLLQATSTETYIQNYEVNEIEYVAPKTYTVTFKNWDGTVLQTETLEENTMPVYVGATPVKEADKEYIYIFKGWDQEISMVTGDVEYVAQFDAINELELDFTEETDGTEYFATLDTNGWAVKDGTFFPEYMPWAATYFTQAIDLSGEKYISFDFLAVKDNGDETQSQFNFMFLTDPSKTSCVGALHCFMESSTPVMTVNKAMGKDKWIGTANFNWADGKYHNVMIIIKDGVMTFEVDGQTLVDNINQNPIKIELSKDSMENGAYFALQATNVMSRIDNFKVKNTYTEYVAPVPEEEILFEEFEQTFEVEEETGFVEYKDSENWVVTEEGRFQASVSWAKAYLEKEIPLTSEKTLTTTICLSAVEKEHQFTIGFSQEENSIYGVYLVFYQDNVTLNYGTAPMVRLIARTENVWYDGAEHELKMIVKNNKLAIVIDGEVIFKDVQLGMNSGYLTVQSSNTDDWIDDLNIKNDAEPLSSPNPEGDVATPPTEEEKQSDVAGKVVKKGFFKKIGEWFKNIFKSIGEWFSGIFSKKK